MQCTIVGGVSHAEKFRQVFLLRCTIFIFLFKNGQKIVGTVQFNFVVLLANSHDAYRFVSYLLLTLFTLFGSPMPFLVQKEKRNTSSDKAQYIALSICFLLSFLIFFHSFEVKAKPSSRSASTPRYASLILDADTGLIVHQQNANNPVYPASLTKMMTLLMVFDALQRGKLSLNDKVVISKHAASMVPSKLDLKPGTSIRVEDAIYALVTKSANDVAVALGEHIGQSESNFAQMMTRKARSLGMSRTRFRNASGLYDEYQVTTARDMGKLAYVLITKYPQYYPYFSKRQFTYLGKTHRNHNRMMETYRGMDGLKTGYIRQSGFNLVASAKRDGRRLVGVVFGGRNAATRNKQMEQLLNDGFATINKDSNFKIAQAQTPTPLKDEPAQDIASLTAQLATQDQREQTQTSTKQEPIVLLTSSEDRWSLLDRSPNSVLTRMIGEGDDDPAIRRRIETGLIAVSALTGASIPAEVFPGNDKSQSTNITNKVSLQARLPQPTTRSTGDWSIQIGAFTSRVSTDQALVASVKRLPQSLRSSHAVVAPVKTQEGWIYRGRLTGYSKETAQQACAILRDCIVIAPQTPQR